MGKFVPFEATDEALLDVHLNLNVKAPYLLTQGLLGALAASKGCVINISSYFANRMLVGRTTTAYSITKGALNSFTKSLAFEVGKLGVRVNAIAPGSVLMPQFERNLSAQDIGDAAVFLASDAAKWVSGAIFAIDGGLTTN
ncbi:SDR family oxidoreductase [uncultured Campylobacter sp.]|uniref:SDR family NAD(P)-dependent oxidoreductase n=1 Tax=uncultured Campylobacter sp. TaxID=218934 RepID=UPI00260487ED|nr:SDR family oxidoreductase [uncultured Campylobacter sp.]